MAITATSHRNPVIALSRSVIAALAGVCVGLLLATAIVVVIATQAYGYRVLTVSSGSMEPVLSKGDLIVTRPVATKDIAKGDIVVYDTEAMTIAHRVVGWNTLNLRIMDSKTGEVSTSTSYQYITKGDANEKSDEPVDQRHVKGELWFTVPNVAPTLGGLGLQWLFLAVTVVLAGAWGVWELRRSRSSAARSAE